MSETYTNDVQRVQCPFCGESNDLSESVDEMLTDWTCGDCDRDFRVRIMLSISVTAWEPTEEHP